MIARLLLLACLSSLAAAQFRLPFFNGPRQPSGPATTFTRPVPVGPPTVTRGTGGSVTGSGNRGPVEHSFNGHTYLVSWRSGLGDFTWDEARNWCSRQGRRMVSLDSPDKAQHFLSLTGQESAPFFWAGGRISGDARTLHWENGRSEGISRGAGFWSQGGFSGPQPERGGDCLAILNNLYNDGIKFHDVSCEHKKATICE